MAFALFSEQPSYQVKVKLFVALAPVANTSHIKGVAHVAASFPPSFFYEYLGHGELKISRLGHVPCPRAKTWCVKLQQFLLFGLDVNNYNASRMAEVDLGGGNSVKCLAHYLQIVQSGQFQKYDYGKEENHRRYKQSAPPLYDVTKVKVPVVAFTGSHDYLADPRDTGPLLSALPGLKAHIDIPGWNHVDFIWGMDAPEYCYRPMVKWMNTFE